MKINKISKLEEMMKKLSLLLPFLVASLGASIIAPKDTWQMSGFGEDVNLTKSKVFTAENSEIIWWYENDDWVDWFSSESKWKGFSKNETTAEKLKEMGLYSDFIKKEHGYWVKAKQDIELPSIKKDINYLISKKGWQLVPFASGASTYSIENLLGNDQYSTMNSNSIAQSIWAYRGGSWRYNAPDMYLSDLTKIYPGEAVWIQSNTAANILTPYPSYTSTSKSGFVNKQISLNYSSYASTMTNIDNNVSLSFSLNQDGTVSSQNQEWNGATWNSYGYDYQTQLDLKNDTNLLRLFLYKDYSGLYYTQSMSKLYITQHKNGISEYTVKNQINNTQYMLNSSQITDISLTESMQANVKTVADELFSLLQNGSSADVTTKLNSMKTTLASVSTNDAKMLKALITLLEVLDNQTIQSLLNIGQDSISVNNLFLNLPDFTNVIALKSDPNTADLVSLLTTLSSTLESSAGSLNDIINDSSYVFYNATNDVKLNYIDAQIIKTLMHAISANISYVSAYEWGADEWYTTKTSNNMEYIKAEINPLELLQSNSFFVNPNSTALTSAKTKYLAFLNSYENLLSIKNFQSRSIAILDISSDINMKHYVRSLIHNLNGDLESVTLHDSSQNYNGYGTTLENTSVQMSLAALFNPSSALSIADFPSLKYNGTYDATQSTLNFSPSDSNGNPLDIINDSSTKLSSSNLTELVKEVYTESLYIDHMSMTPIYLEEDLQKERLTGAELLDELQK